MYLQMSRQPLPREEVNEIHDNCKRMGLLIGKGGIFAQVRERPALSYPFRWASPCCPFWSLPPGLMLRFLEEGAVRPAGH